MAKSESQLKEKINSFHYCKDCKHGRLEGNFLHSRKWPKLSDNQTLKPNCVMSVMKNQLLLLVNKMLRPPEPP